MQFTLRTLMICTAFIGVAIIGVRDGVEAVWNEGYRQGFKAGHSQGGTIQGTHYPVIVDGDLKGWIKQ